MIRDHPGLPTIIATHDYMNNRAERRPNPLLDANSLDPGDNSPQEVWDKLISKHDQIFWGSVANSDTVSKIGLMYCQGQLR